jgi:heme oxygenase
MIFDGGARSALRAETRAHHERVDRIFSSLRLDDRADYAKFLCAQAAAHIPVEDALIRGGIAAIVPDWPKRQRSPAMRSDLAELGIAMPGSTEPFDLDGEAALLGALYVLEGSRLGGAMLARSVGAGLPARFLGGGDSGAWRRLLALLDERLDTALKLALGVKAAAAVFTLFETSGDRYLRTISFE